MRQPEQPPEKQPGSEPEQKGNGAPGLLTPIQWLKERSRAQQDSAAESLGEYLLPVFMGAMETCCVDAVLICVANLNMFGSRETLLPFWAPFVLITGALWLFRRSNVVPMQEGATRAGGKDEDEDEEKKLVYAGMAPLFASVSIFTLFLIWLHVYAQTAFVLDPRWILAFLNDVLLLNARFYQVIAIVGLSLFLCWRGLRLAQKTVEPYDAFRMLYIGLCIIIAVIFVRAMQGGMGIAEVAYNDTLLLLLIPIFIFLSLAAHALAKITFVRRSHPLGLQGSIVAQERAVLGLLGVAGAILLLVTLLLGGSLFTGMQQALAPVWAAIVVAYGWLAQALTVIISIISIPFFWLAELWLTLFPPHLPDIKQPAGKAGTQKRIPPRLDTTSPLFILFIKILLPLLLLLGLFLLIRWTLRRRQRVQVKRGQRSGDVHESVWSWQLFWLQFRTFWRLLFARFFPHSAKTEEAPLAVEEITGEPAARTIREIYRALLKKAAFRGYARKRDETPYEFQERLNERVPLVEPQLAVITESYALTRYGGNVPDESEVARVRSMWNELDSKWESP